MENPYTSYEIRLRVEKFLTFLNDPAVHCRLVSAGDQLQAILRDNPRIYIDPTTGEIHDRQM